MTEEKMFAESLSMSTPGVHAQQQLDQYASAHGSFSQDALITHGGNCGLNATTLLGTEGLTRADWSTRPALPVDQTSKQ